MPRASAAPGAVSAGTDGGETSARPVVTYVGRFSPEKELGLLMSAWDEVHARSGAHLRLIGNGPSQGAMEAFAASRPSVHLEAYLDSPNDVATALGSSDVAVLTSGTETFSLATAEALACGTPVVGPARGAVGELIADSRGGVAFLPGSSAALGAALIDVLARPPCERQDMGRRGRQHIVDHFTWDRVATRLTQAYGSVRRPC